MSVIRPQKVEYTCDTDTRVICTCKHSQPSTVIHNNELHSVTKASTNDTINTYDLLAGCQTSNIDINKKSVVCHADSKIFNCKKLSLLSGQSNGTTWRLRLYQKDAKNQWEQVPIFRPSVLLLDLKNSIPIQKENGIIVASVVPETRTTARVVIYLFSLLKVKSEKDWKATTVLLPSPRGRTAKYEIHSCLWLSINIYCSLLIPEVGAIIYKLGLASLQQPKNINNISTFRPEGIWQIDNATLQNCVLAALRNGSYHHLF